MHLFLNFLVRMLSMCLGNFAVQTPVYYAQEFANIIKLLLQQKGSRLRGSTMEGTHFGQQASAVDQVGAVEMQPVVGRFAPMGRVDAPAARRWVFPNPMDLPQLVDKFDKMQMVIDPTSTYVANALAAAGRQIDRQIITALFGTNYIGQEAGTSVTLPAGQKIATTFGASAATGLTVAKLREARRILMANNVDPDTEEFYLAIHPTNHDQLLAEAQVVSTDFNEKPVLVEGRVHRFMGFTIKQTTLMPYIAGGTVRQCAAFVKSGVHLGVWGDTQTDVSQRKDLQGLPWQVYLYMVFGATRTEEGRVVEIDCQE